MSRPINRKCSDRQPLYAEPRQTTRDEQGGHRHSCHYSGGWSNPSSPGSEKARRTTYPTAVRTTARQMSDNVAASQSGRPRSLSQSQSCISPKCFRGSPLSCAIDAQARKATQIIMSACNPDTTALCSCVDEGRANLRSAALATSSQPCSRKRTRNLLCGDTRDSGELRLDERPTSLECGQPGSFNDLLAIRLAHRRPSLVQWLLGQSIPSYRAEGFAPHRPQNG